MRLFHISEEPNIARFEPRPPARADICAPRGLVWAIDEARLPNYFTPRDCPRVAYYADARTSPADMERFFSSAGARHALAIERGWYRAMRDATLYAYEFDPAEFELQDAVAGYFVTQSAQTPIARHVITDAFEALLEREVELRILGELWTLARAVQRSTLNWSLCRMRNARPAD